MGFTPLEGLVMATRSGSVDPGLLLWLLEHGGLDERELADALEHESGLLGLAGTGDMREVLDRARPRRSRRARSAVDVYVHRLRAGIAAMAASLGGLDALVFTGGVGEHAPRDARRGGRRPRASSASRSTPRRNAATDGDADISAAGAAVVTLRRHRPRGHRDRPSGARGAGRLMAVAAPLILDDPERVAVLAAELVANRMRARPGLRLVLPAGRLPAAVDAALGRHAGDGSLPAQGAGVLDLDQPTALGDLAVLELAGDGSIAGAGAAAPHAAWRARAIILVATGGQRAAALAAMLERPPSPSCPASLLRTHPRLILLCDRASAAGLPATPAQTSDRAVVVLGHREPGISAEHRISDESRARLRHSADIARDEPVRLAVLTGWTRTRGLSEAEQMLTAWDDPDTPALLEVAGRDTAENATRSLPLLLAAGAIRRVTVVTSAWHVRAHWYFAPYREYGLTLDFAPVVTPRSRWGPLIVNELRQIPAAPRIRRERYAAMRLPG